MQINRKVLVVDDETHIRAFLIDSLLEAGYDVLEAASGDEALEILHRETIDCTVTDLSMPGTIDGEALVHIVRNERPLTKIIVISGKPRAGAMIEIADCFITKPFAGDTIVGAVKLLLPG